MLYPVCNLISKGGGECYSPLYHYQRTLTHTYWTDFESTIKKTIKRNDKGERFLY